MKFLRAATLCLSAILYSSCGSSLQVRTDYDREYDFSKFKTYRWAANTEVHPNDELAKNPLLYKRVQAGVDKALTAKGFTKLESGDPDFVVLALAGVKEKLQVYQTGPAYRGWYDPWWGPYGGSTHVSQYEEGTLIIDFVSWSNKELAWRGMGTDVIRGETNNEKVQKRIDEVTAQILAAFPPK